jgi:hypothetical protein
MTDDRNTAILPENDGSFDAYKLDSGAHYKVHGTPAPISLTGGPSAVAAACAAVGAAALGTGTSTTYHTPIWTPTAGRSFLSI